jgi:hypothetical protein
VDAKQGSDGPSRRCADDRHDGTRAAEPEQQQQLKCAACKADQRGQARADDQIEAAVEQVGQHLQRDDRHGDRFVQLRLGRVARLAGMAHETVLQPLPQRLRIQVGVCGGVAQVMLLSMGTAGAGTCCGLGHGAPALQCRIKIPIL